MEGVGILEVGGNVVRPDGSARVSMEYEKRVVIRWPRRKWRSAEQEVDVETQDRERQSDGRGVCRLRWSQRNGGLPNKRRTMGIT